MTAAGWKRLHLYLMLVWLIPMTGAAWWVVYKMPDPHSAFAILLVSNYANVCGHWAAWQATRAEERAT